MTCVLYYYFLKSTNQNYSNYCSLLNRNPHWVDKLWTGSNHEWIIQTTDFISQFWYFSRNFEFTSQNSDFFSELRDTKSQLWLFFSELQVYISQISHNISQIFAQLLVISPVYKRQIFSQNCNNSDFISHNFEFIFCNCVFLWLSG